MDIVRSDSIFSYPINSQCFWVTLNRYDIPDNFFSERLQTMTDKDIHHFCLDWARWKRECSRAIQYYGPEEPKSLIDRLLPSKTSGIEPDTIYSPMMEAFELAVIAQPDDKAKAAMYLYYIIEGRKNIKSLAGKMGLTRDGFYKSLKKFRRKVYKFYLRIEK